MDTKVKVFFPNQNKEIFIDNTATIAHVCSNAGFHLDLVCGGRGKCGKCSVDIERNGKHITVLSCQEKVSDGLKVFLTNENLNKKANILTENMLLNIKINPAVKKVYIEKSKLDTPQCSGDWEHITSQLEFKIDTPELQLLQKLSKMLHDKNDAGITLVIWRNNLIEIEPNDTSSQLYGLAIDLGTTSVVAYLYNLLTGKKVGVYPSLNGQISEGGDVISRISACITNRDGLHKLQSKAVETINGLIDSIVNEAKIPKSTIYTIAICGNSAMQHLFLGLYPEFLGKAPFTSVIQSDIVTTSKQLNLNIHPNGIVHFLPLIGGFVGSDTTAVLLSLPHDKSNKHRLIIDLGTNGEIAVGNNDKYLAASTAAGPALEGAGIHYGMRGTNGAIEKVKITKGKIDIKVIGNEKPIGICGSGLIDAIAEMLRVGIIDHKGKMLTKEIFLEKCNHEYKELSNNLCKIDNINVFVLADENQTQSKKKIFISQKDIRAVQLAKGAIYTGCILLLNEYGLKGNDLEEILIAGAFGNYIDTNNAQYIGLLPSYEGVPIESIGNAAGTGVQKFLLSEEIQNSTLPLLKKVGHLELASNLNFQNEYFKNTDFPNHTKS